MRLKINKMEHFHYRNIGQIGHFFMNFHYARYEKVKKSVPPNIKNEASDHHKRTAFFSGTPNFSGPSYFEAALSVYRIVSPLLQTNKQTKCLFL